MNVSQNHKNNTSKHLKKRLSHEQVRLLEASFDAAKKLEPERKLKLASELGVPPRQVTIWYQNRRARWKSQSLELGYGSLQVRLDAALAEKRRLEEEAQVLRGEIKRARDMLVGCRWTRAQSQAQAHQACPAPPVSSLSSFCDDGVNDDVANGGEVLPFEELYGCLMVTGGTRDPFFLK